MGAAFTSTCQHGLLHAGMRHGHRLVRYDRAGLAAQEAVRALKLEDKVSFIRNNVDHYTGATFGCHENYSLDRKAPLHEERSFVARVPDLARALYRFGACRSIRPSRFRGELVQREDAALFQISQRADYIQNDFSNGCSTIAPSSTRGMNRWPIRGSIATPPDPRRQQRASGDDLPEGWDDAPGARPARCG